jgi:hypothetical protein
MRYLIHEIREVQMGEATIILLSFRNRDFSTNEREYSRGAFHEIVAVG